MKQFFSVLILASLFFSKAGAQDYLTRNGNVSFFSHTPMEDIKAQNNEVVSVLTSATGDFEFKIAVQSFHFPKASMEQHFNDDEYMGSAQYPKAAFKGKIVNPATVNFQKDGTYNVTVQGNLSIKDVTKPITVNGIIKIKNGVVSAQCTFNVNRHDYHIEGQSFVQDKLASQIEVTVNCEYEKI